MVMQQFTPQSQAYAGKEKKEKHAGIEEFTHRDMVVVEQTMVDGAQRIF